MKVLIPLLGRILLVAIFLMSAFNKIGSFSGTQGYMAAHGMPLTALFLVGAIVFELAGGLSILLGFRARWGAGVLIVFLIPTTLIFHRNFSDQVQAIMFMKNLAILGGLLLVAHFGAGPASLDARARGRDGFLGIEP